MQWGIGPSLGSSAGGSATPGQPLYLWMTLEGGPAAVDRLQAGGRLAIDVHWTREGAAASPGAPDLVTELTIGRPDLAPILAAQVRRQGFFAWHSWARKDTLSPGQWSVSLTYPDGRPVLCGQTATQPCRFPIAVG